MYIIGQVRSALLIMLKITLLQLNTWFESPCVHFIAKTNLGTDINTSNRIGNYTDWLTAYFTILPTNLHKIYGDQYWEVICWLDKFNASKIMCLFFHVGVHKLCSETVWIHWCWSDKVSFLCIILLMDICMSICLGSRSIWKAIRDGLYA